MGSAGGSGPESPFQPAKFLRLRLRGRKSFTNLGVVGVGEPLEGTGVNP